MTVTSDTAFVAGMGLFLVPVERAPSRAAWIASPFERAKRGGLVANMEGTVAKQLRRPLL